MRRLHVVILLCLVLIPLSVTVYLGYMSLDRGAQESSAAVRQTLGGRLRDLSGRAFDFIRKEESRLMDLAAASDGLPSSLAALGKTDPEIRQAFLVEDGMFAWPDRSGDNDAYAAFYQRIETLFPDARWTEDSRDEGAPSAEAGWKSWFWSDGEQFLFWRRLDEKRIVGFELIRSAFLSRLAAAFPEVFADEKEGAASRVELRDLRSHVFLQWGGFRNQTARAVADLALDPPLDGWTLQYFADPKLFPGIESQAFWFLLMSGIVLVLVVAGALWYLLRELGRELRDAGNRVSFVNQVSHELKTPLTNIRLYLDLLRSDLDAVSAETDGIGGKKARMIERLEIIDSESARLSRLIHNVLTFSRKDKADSPKPIPVFWVPTVKNALSVFERSLADKNMRLEFQFREDAELLCDPDWISQIIGNLVSNAEKYAWSGGLVRVEAWAESEDVFARISDEGPGIPEADRDRIFEPFVRLGDALTDSAAGAGLGLAIARDLARRMGAELSLEKRGSRGASFLLRVPRRAA